MTQEGRSEAFADWHSADAALCNAIADRRERVGKSILVGIAGAQGSGKTTLVHRLAEQLEQRGLRTAVLSLDDFYVTKAERLDLARRVHPLCVTRGVPGTHEVSLLNAVLDALLHGTATATVPTFDKAADDRGEPRKLTPPFDLVLLEGWCIGAEPQPREALADPVNDLEREEDADGHWRRWVNDRLADDYAALFARIDLRIFLKAPDFAVVEGWRSEQEAKLVGSTMDKAALHRFVAHYQRITQAMLASPPADLVVELDAVRRPRLN
ncbi:kinase [Qipengyuania sp. RANM35]|uniref:kinase n=1 Tax=Qipengyuania sp. RANM35 TaxID=3068635 RepID=UPI0034DAC290